MKTAMRQVVLQMMTTLDGRLDKPFEWVNGVAEDQYQRIEANYRTYDTILAGRTTAEEMIGYWPSALESGEGSDSNRRMARHMHDYRKVIISRRPDAALPDWHNSELCLAGDDAALTRLVGTLKSKPGRDIHLAGGAELARSMIALGLVDRYRFFVYPTVSAGRSWFEALQGKLDMALVDTTSFSNGVLELVYDAQVAVGRGQPQRFTELIEPSAG